MPMMMHPRWDTQNGIYYNYEGGRGKIIVAGFATPQQMPVWKLRWKPIAVDLILN